MDDKKKKGLLIVLIIIALLLGLKSCLIKKQDGVLITNPIKMTSLDPNMVKLKKLIDEDQLCDDEWAKAFSKLGLKMQQDSNSTYLNNYYQSDQLDEAFINQYHDLAKQVQKFAKLFLSKEYQKASATLIEIKEKFLEVGEDSNESLY